VVSTTGDFSVPGPGNTTITGKDEDLIVFNASSDTWELYFDGSDVSLGGDVNGVDIADNGDIYITNHSNFSLAGVSYERNDILVCAAPGTGSNTTCSSITKAWDGASNGLSTTSDIDGFDFVP
jgi:hypothetical protein